MYRISVYLFFAGYTGMRRVLTYQIEQEGTAADFLRGQGYSHRVLTWLKQTPQGLCRNGQEARLREKIKPGDVLTVTIAEDVSSQNIIPVPMELKIIYEDEDILIIDKDADLPVHPSLHNYDNTLANALAAYYRDRDTAFVYRCINRLDRDTTGLLTVARHMLSAAVLSEMGKRREIHREYLAVVSGRTLPEGTIDAPIARREGSVLERTVDAARGERAVTHYRTLSYRDGYSLILLRLETGRTHQIRVHMKYIGHPLIGDFLYNPDYRIMEHQALHSYRLAFSHPITKEKMTFVSKPPWKGLPWNFETFPIS